jgi:hypothetical protein
MEPEFYTRI